MSTRNGGQYSTTIRDEVKAELQIVANASPSASARQSRPRGTTLSRAPRRVRPAAIPSPSRPRPAAVAPPPPDARPAPPLEPGPELWQESPPDTGDGVAPGAAALRPGPLPDPSCTPGCHAGIPASPGPADDRPPRVLPLPERRRPRRCPSPPPSTTPASPACAASSRPKASTPPSSPRCTASPTTRGFLYCSFGRPYGLVVTPERSVTVAANIDGGQPFRRCHGEALTYTDWQRDNFWRAVASLTGPGRRLGIEGDHLTLQARAKLDAFLAPAAVADIAPAAMRQRMVKSPAEIALIREGARIADLGGAAIRDAIRPGVREIDVAMAGRDAMEAEIARAFPNSEIRDTWVWFQSGLNTDGAHNPVTARRLEPGDILSLNAFPMISGYYTALERTLFLGDPDPASPRALGGQRRRPRARPRR